MDVIFFMENKGKAYSSRNPKLVTIRRGGLLNEKEHHLLARWAAMCAEHVLNLCETNQSADDIISQVIQAVYRWADGEINMIEARKAAY